MASPFDACLRARERLDCAERIDAPGHAMQLAAAVAWGFSQSVSNAAESITWGILVAVSVLRVPRIWRCWEPVVRDPVWLALLGWSAWMCVSTSWSPSPPPGVRPWLIERWVVTPLLIWPAMGRPWLVLGAIGAGACVQVASALALTGSSGGPMQAISGFGQLQWQLHCAVALGAVGVRHAVGWWRIGPSIAMVAALATISRAERRLMAVAAVAAMTVAFLRPSPRARPGMVRVVAAASALAVLAWLAAGIHHRVKADAGRVDQLARREGDYSRWNALSGNRLVLAHAAFECGLRHPLIGNGRGSFRSVGREWAIAERVRHPERSSALGPLRSGRPNDAHNAVLNAFCEGGIPAAVMLGGAVVALGVRLWRQSSRSGLAAAALSLFLAVLLGMSCYPITAKAPGAIIAVCLAVSWIGREDAAGPSRARRA